MALSQTQLLEIDAAFTEAFSVINSNEELISPSDENKRRTSSFLLSEQVPHSNWTAFTLQLALLELRKQGRLEQRAPAKTRAEIEAERNARDRADGSRVGNAPHARESRAKETAEDLAAAKQSFQDAINPAARIKRLEQEKAAVTDAHVKQQRAILATIPVDRDYTEFDKPLRKVFAGLDAPTIKIWMQRRREFERLNPPVNADE